MACAREVGPAGSAKLSDTEEKGWGQVKEVA